jgi:cytochrome c-type biogenesis protein CcmH
MTRPATALLAFVLLVSGAQAAQPSASLPDIEDEVMCPICGTALNLSESPQADRERAFIRREIAAGKTKQQIKEDMVAQYGRQVLSLPPKSGFDLAAWLAPLLAVALGSVAILTGVRRWRRHDVSARQGKPRSPASGDEERLDADLAKYDL